MKYFRLIFLICLVAVENICQASSLTPLFNAFLQSNLNGNGQGITNLAMLKWAGSTGVGYALIDQNGDGNLTMQPVGSSSFGGNPTQFTGVSIKSGAITTNLTINGALTLSSNGIINSLTTIAFNSAEGQFATPGYPHGEVSFTDGTFTLGNPTDGTSTYIQGVDSLQQIAINAANGVSISGPVLAPHIVGNITIATNFTGPLTGDVTGTQGATVVAQVGGVTAANVASGATAANNATAANTANTIVLRDSTGAFAGNAGSLTNIPVGFRVPSYYGAKGDGSDDTVALQAASYSGVPTYIPPQSNYSVTHIFLTNNSVFFSQGGKITMLTGSGPLFQGTNGLTNILIQGLNLDGGLIGFTGNSGKLAYSFGASTNIAQAVNQHRTAIVINGLCANSFVQNNTITGFSDYGILVNQGIGALGQPGTPTTFVANNVISNAWIGMAWTNGAEYVPTANNNIFTCGYGYWKSAGNCDINGGLGTGGGAGIRVDGSGVTNPGHSLNRGINFNHNNVGAVCVNLPSGEEFDNCYWIGGGGGGGGNGFFITNCSQVVVHGGRYGGSFIIVDGGANTSNGTNTFNPVDFAGVYGLLPAQMSTPNGGILYLGSVVVNETVQTSLLVNGTITGNGSGLSTLNGSSISSGTVADARLSGNVALLNGMQTFTASNIFSFGESNSATMGLNNLCVGGTFKIGGATAAADVWTDSAGNGIGSWQPAAGGTAANVVTTNGGPTNIFHNINIPDGNGAFGGNGAGLTNITVDAPYIGGMGLVSLSATPFYCPIAGVVPGGNGTAGRYQMLVTSSITLTSLAIFAYDATANIGTGTNITISIYTNAPGATPIGAAMTATINGGAALFGTASDLAHPVVINGTPTAPICISILNSNSVASGPSFWISWTVQKQKNN